jgi:hypothetical protein
MAPPASSPDAVARARRIAKRRGQHASVQGFLERHATPPRRAELVRAREEACARAQRVGKAPHHVMSPAVPPRDRQTTDGEPEIHLGETSLGPLLRRTQAERDAALAECERLREEIRLLLAAERAACAAIDNLVGGEP